MGPGFPLTHCHTCYCRYSLEELDKQRSGLDWSVVGEECVNLLASIISRGVVVIGFTLLLHALFYV